jgi:hypothetical protein
MFQKATIFKLFLINTLLLVLLTSCTGLKSVGDGSFLYTGYDLKVDSTKLISHWFDTRKELNGLFTVKPNKKFLWMRPRLCLYSMMKVPQKPKGFKHWLKDKVAKPPVLLEKINMTEYNTAIENRLYNRGNFDAKSNFQVIKKGKTAKVLFLVSANQPYKLKESKYPASNIGIKGDIGTFQSKSILKPIG